MVVGHLSEMVVVEVWLKFFNCPDCSQALLLSDHVVFLGVRLRVWNGSVLFIKWQENSVGVDEWTV